MYFMKKLTLLGLAIFLLFGVQHVKSQISIVTGSTADELVENIVGDGIEFSNAQVNGIDIMHGIFTNGGSTDLGIDAGIFLTCGSGYTIPGPNSVENMSANNGQPGDGSLSGLSGVGTYDASVLEFDFIPESDTLRFQYVFGSEEYNEWVGSQYNDVFGFFVSGPNPDGGMYSDENIALIPGTDVPVAINNVNNGDSNNGPCTNCEYYRDNGGGLYLEYDGFTVVLTAFLKVVPCEEYHIKMGVADSGDGIYDSGIFLKENSFESPKIDVEADPIPEGVADNMIEGCVEADIVFRLPNSSYAPVTVNYAITGTAINGIDYEPIDNFVEFAEGEDTVSIHVVPIADFITEGTEDITIIVENNLGCNVRYDTVMFLINDYLELETESLGEISICQGQSTDIFVNTSGGVEPYTINWSTGEPGDTTSTINVTPEEDTWYYFMVSDMCGSDTIDSVFVQVLPVPEINLGNDTTLCGGEELVLDAGSGYSSYVWSDNSTGQTLTVTEAGTYWVQVTAEGGCSATDEIVVNFTDPIDLFLGNDTLLCAGNILNLQAPAGLISYQWQDGSTGSNLEVSESGTYWVYVTNDDGCAASDTINVFFEDETSVDLGPDQTVCSGTEVVLDPGFYNEYVWQDGSTTPTYTVTQAGTYSVNVLGGCGWASDEIVINYYPETSPDLGPDTTICYTDGSYILNPGSFQTVVWQNGETAPTFQVYETGYYSVTVTDFNNCEGTDEVYVRVGQAVQLGPDTSFCQGDSIQIAAGSDFDFFQWTKDNDPEILGTTNTLYVSEEGTYTISAGLNDIECNSSDDIFVKEIPVATANLQNEDICEGDTLKLSVDSDPSYEYYWNDEPGTNEFFVTDAGTYWVRVGNMCGYASDTIDVNIFPLPDVEIGDHYLITEEGDQVQLDAGDGFVSYTWQDGSSQSTYNVTFESAINDSVYYVEVFDGKCYNTDTVIVEAASSPVPILLTPNGDEHNDIFKPLRWSGIKEHTIIVFNRWGEKVWESNNFPEGWDGTDALGHKVADGTYYWVLEATYSGGLKKVFKGSLTILNSN